MLNDEKSPCTDTLKTNMAVFKTCLESLKTDVKHITEVIERLTKETTEYQMQMKYMYNDIERFKEYYNDIKTINETVHSLQTSVEKLENTFLKHTDASTNTFASLNLEINQLKAQIDKMPLIYQPKPLTRSVGDVIKMAPGVIAIISALLAMLVLYLKGIING
jgi:SMC interacting uncharacterized protein involved in chromosome segregation